MLWVQESKRTSDITKKDCIWNPAICSFKNDKYLASIIDHSMIKCHEIMDPSKYNPKIKIN